MEYGSGEKEIQFKMIIWHGRRISLTRSFISPVFLSHCIKRASKGVSWQFNQTKDLNMSAFKIHTFTAFTYCLELLRLGPQPVFLVKLVLFHILGKLPVPRWVTRSLKFQICLGVGGTLTFLLVLPLGQQEPATVVPLGTFRHWFPGSWLAKVWGYSKISRGWELQQKSHTISSDC